ncbi:hypothetical protein GGH19_004441 [Coemansia sp. RSA 1807]|nr:hypothetical protein LPJ58_002685 [Coemansia sp. RSA 1591]KAJ1764526.1 hypothetical protein LPJ69_001792 [Coemansia sp. RSA 1752]KAJ1791668.1 hypothetical protein LPJ67_001787 [Coemansia sp. RSA 1938]KAJ1792492.1 hypothetical protein LPJ62_000809 [Coemansia sp. RSA 2167]KAJ2154234.1 hypothetical protein J3F82_001372 [Coemansia sp. RSA 637]KAJ2167611.1 hypothetical protein GGH15_002003 [Coemansia sp. RSA 562]KAJ2196059.1 hypothetical protein IW144_003125 [Coemansia sp. RSA 522]KAJ2203857.1
MDNRKKGGAGTPTGGGSYEMLDRNAQNQYGADPSAPPMAQPQPHYAQHNQDNVSRSDLDVLETNHGAEPYGYNVYPGYHNPAEPAAPYPAPPYPADAGVGYFQDPHYGQQPGAYHQDYANSGFIDPMQPQAVKPLPTPHAMTLHEAYSLPSTPVMSDDTGPTGKEGKAPPVRFDPRIMPEADPAVASLYDVNQAPPPGARNYKRFQSKRRRQLRAVELTSGNVVIDNPVPDAVLDRGKYKEAKEFTHLRYTAVTCDPNYFKNEKYTLRQSALGRDTELFIVLTMYNEDEVLFNRTFASVMKNIRHLCSRTNSRMWGKNAWEKVVVCIVADGMNKIDKRVLAVLGALGVYQEGIMQKTVDNKDTTAHLFEYTTQSCLDANMNFVGHQQDMPPVQVLFCLKAKNQKKINSHRWFFNAFAEILNPNICVLIDVGTKPTGTSIYHLWKSFDHDERVAGACGEIAADLGKKCKHVLLNPLVAAQNFEYKISNILDKPLESVFGYISVLPGAFSAYRYNALKDTSEGVGPLAEYFKGELMHSSDADNEATIFQANMYLAEDRILCFELVAKRRCNYILRYVKAAKAVTDVPDNLAELISQRRRWLNGSFFAAFYACVHWYRMFGTSHSLYRRFMLTLELIYQTINMIFSWFAIANFYLAYFFLEQNLKTIWDSQKTDTPMSKNSDPFHGAGYIVMEVFRELYILALVMQFVLSLGNRPQGTKAIYRFSVLLFTIIMIIITYVALYGVVYTAVHIDYEEGIKSLLGEEKFRDIIISMAATYGVYFIASFLYFEPWHMFTSFIQYMLWLPSSINILMVYAFCNTHDVSWGTKGDTGVANTLGNAKIKVEEDGKEVAHIPVAGNSDETNKEYEEHITELKSPRIPEENKRDAATKREDQNKSFRTRLVLSWMCSNIVLAMVISSEWFADVTTDPDSTGSHNYYLSFIFWSVAGLAVFRFIGSVWYRIRFLFHD